MTVGYVAPLKGIMSEAELHFLQRPDARGAASNKAAASGELFNHVDRLCPRAEEFGPSTLTSKFSR